MQKWKATSLGIANIARKRSITVGWSVVGTEPMPSECAASIKFCVAGITDGGARRHRAREHDARHVLHLVGELAGELVVLLLRRNVRALGPAPLFLALGPPRLVIDLAELADDVAVG